GELIRSFLELRRVVAAEAVALACERATAEQLAFLGELAEQQQQEEDAAAFAERDLRFARALVRSAGNLAMELLLNSVERIYLSLPEVVTAMHADRPAVRASYSQVVGLVQARQATLARVAVRMVLEKQDARTLEMLSNRADAGERPC
ncbi:MAG: FCD domain-containing protein, partial [Deltaproteobacteria bacterium]|nr:FCD domain-containing protein [Deltaproteobacteria bacterium]